MTGFPTSPIGAFNETCAMADKLGMALIPFVEKAKQIPSTVYRWKTNLRSYDVTVFSGLVDYYDRELKRRKKAKVRQS